MIICTAYDGFAKTCVGKVGSISYMYSVVSNVKTFLVADGVAGRFNTPESQIN